MIMEIGQVAEEFMKIAMMKSRHKFEQFIIWHVRLFSKRENVNSTRTFNFGSVSILNTFDDKNGQFWYWILENNLNFGNEILEIKFRILKIEQLTCNKNFGKHVIRNNTLGSALFFGTNTFLKFPGLNQISPQLLVVLVQKCTNVPATMTTTEDQTYDAMKTN